MTQNEAPRLVPCAFVSSFNLIVHERVVPGLLSVCQWLNCMCFMCVIALISRARLDKYSFSLPATSHLSCL